MMKLALAGWSIVRRFRRQDNPLILLDYPKVAKEEFGINVVELNNVFMASHDQAYLKQLCKVAADAGVKMIGMAVDGTGDLSLLDENQRKIAVKNAMEYFDISEALGLSYFRVNTGGQAGSEDMLKRCIESFRELAEEGKHRNIKVVIENHGGLSTDPNAIVKIMKEVGLDSIGTLPDFGNFPEEVRYEGIEKIAPYAVAFHAKFTEFSSEGEDVRTDAKQMIDIIKRSGFDGYLCIEFGGKSDDHEGVLKSKALLERYI